MLEAIDAARLLDTALRLVEVQSWTGQAGDAADRLAQILEEDGFEVQRPEADWPAAPAGCSVRHRSCRPDFAVRWAP